MSDSPKKRSSLNISLDDSPTKVELSKSQVFDIVVGTPKSEKMLGDNSNAGTTLSTDTTISTYSIGFDKTVEHVTRMVPEFSGGIDEKLIFFINACELVAEITPVANRDIMLRTILTRIRGQAYEVIRYEEITSWEMLKTLLKNTYNKPINAAYLQIELFSAKQRYKESLIEYATRIRNLVQAVSEGSTQGKSTSDALAVKTNIREQALLVFLEGINDKIKVMVISKNPSTLEQAIQIAIIEDKNITHLMKCRELASITMCPETQPLRIGSAGLPCEVDDVAVTCDQSPSSDEKSLLIKGSSAASLEVFKFWLKLWQSSCIRGNKLNKSCFFWGLIGKGLL
ncbi:hypothetical protein QTP88_011229 [Uroleucon formosanum]